MATIKNPLLNPEFILDIQGHKCAVCKADLTDDYAIDRSKSDKIIGILCHNCHESVNKVKEDVRLAKNLVSYVVKHSSRQNWDRHFLNIAFETATRSKDPSTQVGAVIVRDRNIISTGYNGFPRGVNDNVYERYQRPDKYVWTIHAEENAILNAGRNGVSTEGATLYVTPLHPCISCAKAIVQSGIKEVVYEELFFNERWEDEFKQASIILKAARVLTRPLE